MDWFKNFVSTFDPKKQGGPAFPTNHAMAENSEGMTLRDYFAAKAMQGFAADPNYGAKLSVMAECAYEWADAMLEARKGGAT